MGGDPHPFGPVQREADPVDEEESDGDRAEVVVRRTHGRRAHGTAAGGITGCAAPARRVRPAGPTGSAGRPSPPESVSAAPARAPSASLVLALFFLLFAPAVAVVVDDVRFLGDVLAVVCAALGTDVAVAAEAALVVAVVAGLAVVVVVLLVVVVVGLAVVTVGLPQ